MPVTSVTALRGGQAGPSMNEARQAIIAAFSSVFGFGRE
jgi:hypothetical protein